MDSPVRQYLKQKDYRRHKLFRKMKRRRAAALQLAIDAPIKEMRRRLKRYDGGKNVPMDRSISGINLWRDDKTGLYFYQEGDGLRIDLTPFNTLGSDDPTTWSFLDAEGKIYTPKKQYTGPTMSELTDAQRVANEARAILNTRTWRSDVADQLHNFGEALMWSTMAMDPAGKALMMKASEKATPYVEKWADVARKTARRLKKPFTRLNLKVYGWDGKNPLIEQYDSDWFNGAVRKFENEVLAKDPRFLETPDKRERAEFIQRYVNFQNDPGYTLFPSVKKLKDIGITDYNDINRIFDIFRHNPEYLRHWILTGESANPLNLKFVDDFIRRQGRSIRGVTASTKEDAIEYLTSTQKGRRLTGGDRLSTDGGLYVSNSPEIGDRFKNPVGRDTEDGYIGILNYDFGIPTDIPIEEQLRLLRAQIDTFDGPLSGTRYRYGDYDDGVKAVESNYVGRAKGNGSGFERAYLPSKTKGVIDHPVTLEELRFYPNQIDQRGRWANDISSLPVSTDLFIPKLYNGYDDFIKTARQFLKPRVNPYTAEYILEVNNYGNVLQKHVDLRRNLLSKLAYKQEGLKQAKHVGKNIAVYGNILGGIFGGSAFGINHVILNEKMLGEFYNSPEYKLFESALPPMPEDENNEEGFKLWEEINDKLYDEYLQKFRNRTGFNSGKDSGIHIKPLNRGKFTALKKRTGKSASWFKAHGTPALKKMATFALNARKWKHK